ncbi:MAG: MinD/ParA family protein [Desulfococcaceae bacterium]|nr:MinD/ParA family protein [Desulfococcaceae bacterium]
MNNQNIPGKVIDFSALQRKRLQEQYREKAASPTRIVSITSGKGGVGKTTFAINLGFAMSKMGKRVLILDADLGLGNLDVLLGLTPRYNLSHVIRGEKKIEEVIACYPDNIKILSSSSGIQEMTDLSKEQSFRLISEIDSSLRDIDILLIDTAAGISPNVTYFNTTAQEILVIVVPEPASITDAYALMKVLSMRFHNKYFKILINFAESIREAQEVFRQLRIVSDRFLDISLEYFGCVLADENITKAIKQQQILVQEYPESTAAKCYHALAKKFIGSHPHFYHRKSSGSVWKHFRQEL